VSEDLEKKVSTDEQTRALVAEGLSLKEVAEKRGMTVGTIISHLEKLQKRGVGMDLSHLKPKTSDLKRIQKAFSIVNDMKLAPVHRKLKSAYTYDELRIARLFL
jgi:ATP-dependent DNA helicase RecQ